MSEEYQLEILPEAKDDLASIDQTQAKQIAKKIRWLAKNATDLPHIAMQGEDGAGLFRLRVGDYRVSIRLTMKIVS